MTPDAKVEAARQAFVSEIARLAITGKRSGPGGNAVLAYRMLESAIAERARQQTLTEVAAKVREKAEDQVEPSEWEYAAAFIESLQEEQ